MKPATEVVGQLVRDVLAYDEAMTFDGASARRREFERLAAQAAPGSLGQAVAGAVAEVLARVVLSLQGQRPAR
ncbi:hypothetical protein [Methylorubrum sp. POS3]|uniref:hypothetical protein n=1 Tax=Methylorubrum sp. POS3 TaxID=2998492 RepID=UPI00372A760C